MELKTKKNNYSILFEHLDRIKKEDEFTLMQGTMVAVSELKDPIEKLKQIVMDKEDCFYNIVTLT